MLASSWMTRRGQERQAQKTLESRSQVYIGRTFRSARAITGTGDTVSVLPRAGLRVLYIFNPQCGICRQIKPDVAEFAARLADRLVSISMDPDSSVFSYWTATASPRTLVAIPTVEWRAELAVSGTPLFLVVDSGGTVRRAQLGFLNRDEMARRIGL